MFQAGVKRAKRAHSLYILYIQGVSSLSPCTCGMDDIIIMHLHCTVPRALTVLYCTCSDLQFMFILFTTLVG